MQKVFLFYNLKLEVNPTMPSTYSSQRSRMVEIRDVILGVIKKPSIDVDGVRIVEINEEHQALEEIILEPDLQYHQTPSRRLNGPQKTKRPLSLNGKFLGSSRTAVDQNISNNSYEQKKREKSKMMYEFREKLLRLMSHFVLIESMSVRNRVSSEKIYNIIQERRLIQEKFSQEASIIKQWFEMEYTNKLSLLAYAIVEKQNRYDVYEQHQQIDKVLNLIETQIEEMTYLYLAHQEDKMHLIYSEDLHQAVLHIKRKTPNPENLITLSHHDQSEDNPLPQIKDEIIPQIKDEIIIEKAQNHLNHSCIEEQGYQTSSQNYHPKPSTSQLSQNQLNPFLIESENPDLKFLNATISKAQDQKEDQNEVKPIQYNEDQASQLISLTEQKEQLKPDKSEKKDLSNSSIQQY